MTILTIIDCMVAGVFATLFGAATRRRTGQTVAGISIGAGLTALWAIALAAAALEPTEWWIAEWLALGANGLDILRSGAWLLLLLMLIKPARTANPSVGLWRSSVIGTIVLATAVAGADAGQYLRLWNTESGFWPFIGLNAHLAFGLFGLIVVENVWRNAPNDNLWSIKFLLIAVGSLCAYDFYCYADALLFNRIDTDLISARPLVALLTAPLIGLAIGRRPFPKSNLAISRHFVFHSAALLGGGLYLLIMGAAGLYIRSFGGSWGPVVQVAFLVGAGVLLVCVLSSGSFRARAKLLIVQHLFADKYDYRHEWLRFIATLAQGDGGNHLQLRVIKAIAQIVESPGGSLWLWDDASQSYAPVERWNDSVVDDREPTTGSLAVLLAQTQQVVDFDKGSTSGVVHNGFQPPDWLLSIRDPWLVVPLVHLERLLGFALLHRSRAPRHLDREDYDLLKTIGRQAAGFLAEHQASRALDDAREMDLFNRRFAFVVHDVKTMISQLSLLLANADKHGQNPDFQTDLIASVRDSVDSMNRLLSQINAKRRKTSRDSSVDLAALARQLVQRRTDRQPEIILDCGSSRLPIAADDGRVTAIVGHLLQNAIEAARHTVRVTVRGAKGNTRAVIEVEDDGPGMDSNFVRDRLFQPFASTKRSGFGIGAYQCRELTRELGGWLTVSSVPGRGTTMRVTFPVIADSTGDGPDAMAAR